MKNIDISKHFTELDRSVLKAQEEYADYFNFLRNTFSYLIKSFNDRTTDDSVEVKIMHMFIQKFLNTIEVLRMKYIYEEEHPLRIDLTDSSFPNHIEIKKIYADLEQRTKKLNKLPDKEVLKKSILDFIFEKKTKPTQLLKKLSQKTYFEKLTTENLFTEFTAGDLVQLEQKNKDKLHYLIPWGAYDSVYNRPFVYILIFEYDTKGAKSHFMDSVFTEQFITELRKLTNNTSPLKVMAYDIDNLFDFIHPKVLKRIDLGPIYSRYSKDESVYSKAIQTHFSKDDFVMLFTNEIIFSIGETKTKSFLSKGQLRQIFFIDESNKETMERHVSKVLKYIIAPHHVVQHLKTYQSDKLKEFSMEPISVV